MNLVISVLIFVYRTGLNGTPYRIVPKLTYLPPSGKHETANINQFSWVYETLSTKVYKKS
ncbi:hypothetical protein HanXRQr2_Chr05g0226891 [Helianthus annuus]|uniref:Uncharacterized protein n=1 Tax=Helianthus annuus TaxID=4232 RepID=A0A9K3J172_HELAN|nr:hypothetical protein HanXRQr2_Chr05g0226891 [Helianthus annuus]KAJ0923680.1 hypothetical protein HanPSC8_Chr05g0218891 [Helianthus annuus]